LPEPSCFFWRSQQVSSWLICGCLRYVAHESYDHVDEPVCSIVSNACVNCCGNMVRVVCYVCSHLVKERCSCCRNVLRSRNAGFHTHVHFYLTLCHLSKSSCSKSCVGVHVSSQLRSARKNEGVDSRQWCLCWRSYLTTLMPGKVLRNGDRYLDGIPGRGFSYQGLSVTNGVIEHRKIFDTTSAMNTPGSPTAGACISQHSWH